MALLAVLAGCSSTAPDDGTNVATAFAAGFVCGLAHGALVQADPDFRFTPLC